MVIWNLVYYSNICILHLNCAFLLARLVSLVLCCLVLIAPCFHIFTSFSKVVVFVFGTTSRGPHTVLERLSIWSSLLWHSGQEVSLCIKVTSAAPWALSAALHLVLTISCATFLFMWVTFKNFTEFLLHVGIFRCSGLGARFAWCQSQT